MNLSPGYYVIVIVVGVIVAYVVTRWDDHLYDNGEDANHEHDEIL